MENVCQRAGLNQNEFFGLRYLPKGASDDSEMKWVDLDRPLNRQLEKHSANSKILYLRIMYYVISGVSLITDEPTRNYYFLQLKQVTGVNEMSLFSNANFLFMAISRISWKVE